MDWLGGAAIALLHVARAAIRDERHWLRARLLVYYMERRQITPHGWQLHSIPACAAGITDQERRPPADAPREKGYTHDEYCRTDQRHAGEADQRAANNRQRLNRHRPG